MERMPSLGLILDTFERERDRQLSHFDAVDTKAGVVLGFAGVTAAFSNGAVLVLRIPTLVSGLVAASFALAAFWPRRLPTVEPGALRDYIMAEDRITRLVLDEARGLLGDKPRRLKVAMASPLDDGDGDRSDSRCHRGDCEMSVSDKPKQPAPPSKPEVPTPPPPKPDPALITYIERGKGQEATKRRR